MPESFWPTIPTDTVVSGTNYTLGANVEQLELSGSLNIDGTGNDLNNKIFGNGASNVLDGSAGSDVLYGYGGNDTLIGGTGKDRMTGGAGDDHFVFNGGDISGDRITDFVSGQDKIDLSGVDASTLTSGDQAFHFVGTDAFSRSAGELRVEEVNGNTHVLGDLNGDGIADFVITLDGLHTLSSSDFIF